MSLKPALRANEFEKFKDKYEIVSVAVSNSSSGDTFSSLKSDVVRDILVQNTGATDFYFRLDTSAPTATTGDTLLGSGESVTFNDCGFTHFAAITSSGTSTMVVTGIGRDL